MHVVAFKTNDTPAKQSSPTPSAALINQYIRSRRRVVFFPASQRLTNLVDNRHRGEIPETGRSLFGINQLRTQVIIESPLKSLGSYSTEEEVIHFS